MVRKKEASGTENKVAPKPRKTRKIDRTGYAAEMTEEEMHKFAEEVLETHAVFNMCASVWGPEKVVLRASKFGALELMQSPELSDRVLALQRMVMEDLTLEERPTVEEIPRVLEAIMNEMADQIARRSVEDNIEKKIDQKMEERHQEFV